MFNKIHKIQLALIALVVSVFALSPEKAAAQAYCTPVPQYGWQYYAACPDQDYYGWIGQFNVIDATTGQYAINSTSPGLEQYKLRQGGYQMKVGTAYNIQMMTNGGYNGVASIYMDMNMDGDFVDAGEMLYSPTYVYWYNGLPNGTCPSYYIYYFNPAWSYASVTLPCSTPVGNTRIRAITSLYWSANPCIVGYEYPAGNLYYGYGEMEDFEIQVVPATPSTFPGAGTILYANEAYNGVTRLKNGVMTSFPKFSMSFVNPQPAGTQVKMEVRGPLPSNDLKWQATDQFGNTTITFTGSTSNYTVNYATGVYHAGNGAFQGASGGEYRLVTTVSGAGCPGESNQLFTVAYDYDMSTAKIISPKTDVAPSFFKYKIGTTMAVVGEFQNAGLNEVDDFWAYAFIRDLDNNNIVYADSIRYYSGYSGYTGPLTATQKKEFSFRSFRLFNDADVGRYYIELKTKYILDMEPYNNNYPRPIDPLFTMMYSYDIEIAATEIFAPATGEILKTGKTIRPRAEFTNLGISDASNVPALMTVTKDNVEYYRSEIVIEDVPQGRYNTRTVFFDPLSLDDPGTYEVCIQHFDPADGFNGNDKMCTTFQVESGIMGTYTVGTEKETSPGFSLDRNFASIQEAADALYFHGVSGSTVLELTDANYSQTAPNAGSPALDFRSRIVGLGVQKEGDQIYTLTIKPSLSRSVTKGGVTIDLTAQSGIGVAFGQEFGGVNSNALVNPFPTAQNSNTSGYIIFDGGAQKSIRLRLNTSNANFGSAVYMQRGTHHITLKNLLIETSASQLANKTYYPNTTFSSTSGIRFQDDIQVVGGTPNSYSAGITSRGTLVSPDLPFAAFADTLTNSYNTFMNNEIQGFGYGIISTGMGGLRVDGPGIFKRYYNGNNVYEGNRIWNVAKAGIYVGNEEKSSISKNRIWNVGNGTTPFAAGIMTGGNRTSTSQGYNVAELKISGNEISDVTSNSVAKGISMEQDVNIFDIGQVVPERFPEGAEANTISNNIVRDIKVTAANASRAGIHLYTSRKADMITPAKNDYMTRNDVIYNNTVILGPSGFTGTGITIGVGVQGGFNTTLMNNAISVVDPNVSASATATAALFYQGITPNKPGGLKSDRNAFYTGNNNNISLYRVIETDAAQGVLSNGFTKEYNNLDQVRAWFGTEENSVYYNFASEYALSGAAPYTLRVASNPYPLNSLINNRGAKLENVKEDIDGNLRGAAGQRYDIGAVEFQGRLHVVDLSPEGILAPRTYRATEGIFSDAQYIMTQAPVNIKVNLRNNGSIQMNGSDMKLSIYMQNADGSWPSSPELTKTIKVGAPATDNVTADFNLGSSFNPMTYSDLINDGEVAYQASMPARFSRMAGNVTPLYRITVETETDQANNNNISTKDVRFYLSRSTNGTVIAGENTWGSATSGVANTVAGRLNFDMSIDAFNKIGYFHDWANDRYDFDQFDYRSWEQRAVNYSMYNSVILTDGHESAYDRIDVMNLTNFIHSGNEYVKKNLIFNSEEVLRKVTDQSFTRNILRGAIVNNDPDGTGSYNNKTVKGVAIAKDYILDVASPINPGTMLPYTNDPVPMPAHMNLVNTDATGKPLPGIAEQGLVYNLPVPNNNKTAAVASSTIRYNVVFTGIEWRHLADVETFVRGAIDYIRNNGSDVVPVELTTFNANTNGKSVVLDWATASEKNSAKFVVERANVTSEGAKDFAPVAEIAAAGQSATAKYYSTIDKNVEFGNSYAYRLKVVDLDGQFEHSNIEIVTLTSTVDGIAFGNAYPNPASAEARFSYNLNENTAVTFTVFDTKGNAVATFSVDGVAGNNEFRLDAAELPNGSYTVVMKAGNAVLSQAVNVVR